MSLAKRVLFVAALAAFLAPGGKTMGAEPGRVELLKAEMVRSAIDPGETQALPDPLKQALRRAAALTGVRVYSNLNTHTITLDLTGAVIPDAYFGESGRDLVVDLHGAIALPELSTMIVDQGGNISGIEAYLAAVEPHFVTRVSIKLASPVRFQIVESDESITIELQHTPGAPASAFNRERALQRIEQAALIETRLRYPEYPVGSVEERPVAASRPSLMNLAGRLESLARGDQAPQRPERLESKLARLNRGLTLLNNADRPSATRGARLQALERALEAVQATEPVLAVPAPGNLASLNESGSPAISRRGQTSSVQTRGGAQTRTMPLRTRPMTNLFPGLAAQSRPIENGRFLMAQAQEAEVTEAEEIDLLEEEPAPPDPIGELNLGSFSRAGSSYTLRNPDVDPEDDPLQRLVNLDFREMPLVNIVKMLQDLGQINIMTDAVTDGVVTASFKDVPLGQGVEAILRMQGLGIIYEQGIYRITTWEEAVETRRETKIIYLKKASADEIAILLTEITTGTSGGAILKISSDTTRNIILLSGPSELVQEFSEVVGQLDIAEPVIPTVTDTIPLNYAEPTDLMQAVNTLLSDVGSASFDLRSRQLIITDLPIKVEEIRELVAKLDMPMKLVSIEAMIVDAVMSDDAQTGVDWVMNSLRRLNSNGENVGNLAALQAQSDFTTGPLTQGVVTGINLGGQIAFSILSGDWDISAAIAAEVRTQNAELLASPLLVTIENKPARISIAQEIPFQELTQTTTGPPISTTEFKEVGTVLQVTPRVTYDNHIIVEIDAKQSDVKGESITGVPPEDKREIQTTLMLRNGQTIFIGGLRRFDDDMTVRKTPILGDIPILNLLFRNQSVVKEKVELLIFLTCHVLPEDIPDLTPFMKSRFDALGGVGPINTARDLVQGYLNPETPPVWKWRREK